MKISASHFLCITAGILSLFISSCKKESNNQYENTELIRVYLKADNTLKAYEVLDIAGNVIKTVNFSYTGTAIIENSDKLDIKKYCLNSLDQIESMLDSTSTGCDTLYKFIYDSNGYLKNLIRIDPPFNLEYFYYPDYLSLHSNVFYFINFLNIENLVDVVVNPETDHFLNLTHLGKQNKRLIERIRYGANGGPSTYPCESRFAYKLDKNGFVTQKIELFNPGHHLGDPFSDDDILRYLTNYEYFRE